MARPTKGEDAMSKRDGQFEYETADTDPTSAIPTTPRVRPLHVIAGDIRDHWEKPFLERGHPAEPYIRAMGRLSRMTEMYGKYDAEEIVLKFLGNAAGWRGEDAKRIKAELRSMLPKRGRR